MPSKKKQAADKVSKKAEQKKKKSQIDDRTFGLKNKNKSKKVQGYVQSVTNSVNNSGGKEKYPFVFKLLSFVLKLSSRIIAHILACFVYFSLLDRKQRMEEEKRKKQKVLQKERKKAQKEEQNALFNEGVSRFFIFLKLRFCRGSVVRP